MMFKFTAFMADGVKLIRDQEGALTFSTTSTSMADCLIVKSRVVYSRVAVGVDRC